MVRFPPLHTEWHLCPYRQHVLDEHQSELSISPSFCESTPCLKARLLYLFQRSSEQLLWNTQKNQGNHKDSHSFALELQIPMPNFLIRLSRWLTSCALFWLSTGSHIPSQPFTNTWATRHPSSGRSSGFILIQHEYMTLLAHRNHFQMNHFLYPAWHTASQVPVPAWAMGGGVAASLLLELTWIYIGLKRLSNHSLWLRNCWVLLQEWCRKILVNRKASATEEEKKEYGTKNRTRWTSSLWCHIILYVCTAYTPSLADHPAAHIS